VLSEFVFEHAARSSSPAETASDDCR
jgi:hypothetical protein